MKNELRIFLTAIMFYTRLPVPKMLKFSDDDINQATRYLPVIGWIVGGICAIIFWGFNFFLPKSISIIFSMASGILITGAFHEDGFADVCDGFGGGYTPEQRLEIMKDSRIGTYGTIGLIFVLLFKFLMLSFFNPGEIVLFLIIAHSVSRLMPIIVIYTGRYSRSDSESKIKPVGKKTTKLSFLVAILFALLPLILVDLPYFLLILLLPVILTLFFKKFFMAKISGYTGDCLGAIQQVSELAIYLSAYIIIQF